MPVEAKWGISALVGAGLVVLGWRFFWVLTSLHVMVCFLLVIVVLLQSGKAADLAGAFGAAGSQTAFGPRGAATFLSRATTWCAIMFMATSMALVLRQSRTQGSLGSIFERMGSKPAEPSKTAPITVPVPITPPPPGSQNPAPQQTPPQQTPAQKQPPAKP